MDALSQIFLKIFNMSLAASWFVLAVALFRLVFKRAPKALVCVLWGLVALRLVVPFSFQSVLSLVPSAETIPQNIAFSQAPAVHTGFPALNSTLNPVILQEFSPQSGESANPLQLVLGVASLLWLAAVALMAGYALLSYALLRRKLAASIETEKGVWLCDGIPSAFVLGLFRPKIFLPSELRDEDRKYVLAHEKAHIKAFDHWWKLLGFAVLSLHCFNPLVWLAYLLFCRDLEFACDERVIKSLGPECKKSYSRALINCNAPKRSLRACPLAFGENGVKARIKSVLNYKKPAFWLVLLAVLAIVALCAFFLTDPEEYIVQDGSSYEVSDELSETESDFFALEFAEVVGEEGMFSSVLIDDSTQNLIFVLKDGYFYGSEPFSSSFSEFVKFNLLPASDIFINETNFEGYFSETFEWDEGYSAEELRLNNRKTFYLSSLNGEAVYVMLQNDGSKFVVYGYFNDDDSAKSLITMRYVLRCEDFAGEVDALLEKLEGGSEIAYKVPVLDALMADLDGDGDEEQLSLTYGPTSGLLSYRINVAGLGDGETTLSNWFVSQSTNTCFVQTEEGVAVKTLDYQGNELIYPLRLVDGQLKLGELELN